MRASLFSYYAAHGRALCAPTRSLSKTPLPSGFLPDDFSHEQSMVLETGRGLVVLNSCCHGGVVNIVKGVLDQFPRFRSIGSMAGSVKVKLV